MQRFLAKLMPASAGVNPDADLFEPDRLDVDYDSEPLRQSSAMSQVDTHDHDETPSDTTLNWLPEPESEHNNPSLAVDALPVRRSVTGHRSAC